MCKTQCIDKPSLRQGLAAWLPLMLNAGSKLKIIRNWKVVIMSKKINTRELVSKIEKLTKEKIASQPVVSLDKFRETQKKEGPHTLLIIEDDVTMRKALQRIF